MSFCGGRGYGGGLRRWRGRGRGEGFVLPWCMWDEMMVCCDERCRRWPIYSVITNYTLFRKAYLYMTHFVIQLEMAICLSMYNASISLHCIDNEPSAHTQAPPLHHCPPPRTHPPLPLPAHPAPPSVVLHSNPSTDTRKTRRFRAVPQLFK